MLKWARPPLGLITAFLSSALLMSAAAQPATCRPAFVAKALLETAELCTELGRNQACYGSFSLSVTPREGVELLEFEVPGDTASVADMASLELSPLALDVPEWGIAMMVLQANLPDSLPGQNVTVVLFGDVQIENRGEAETLDDTTPLPSTYGPMQAFSLRTGIGTPACSEAPSDGILIQTPEGDFEIVLEINRVTVRFGSTAFVNAAPGDMRFSLLDGTASLSIDGEDFTELQPGQTAVIPLDEDGDPAGEEITIEDTDPNQLLYLPVGLLPLSVEVSQAGSDVPRAGRWLYTLTSSDETTCAGLEDAPIPNSPMEVNLTLSETGELHMLDDLALTLQDGVWRTEFDNGFGIESLELVFSGDTATVKGRVPLPLDGGCVVVVDAEMEYLGE